MLNYQERDAEILNRRKEGATYTEIAREFGVSRERVRQILLGFHMEKKRRERSKEYRKELRLSDDIHKKWPKDFLSDALLFQGEARWRMERFIIKQHAPALSLKDLMDLLIVDKQPLPLDRFEAMPAYNQKDIGRKTYHALVQHLSELDLCPAFNEEWGKRLKKLLRYLAETDHYIPPLLRRYL